MGVYARELVWVRVPISLPPGAAAAAGANEGGAGDTLVALASAARAGSNKSR